MQHYELLQWGEYISEGIESCIGFSDFQEEYWICQIIIIKIVYSEVINYWPISVLPVFSKLFENVLKIRLVDFIERLHILHSSQHGLQSRKSTITAMVDLLDGILDALNDIVILELMCLDLSMVLDRVRLYILLQTLQFYDVRKGINLMFDPTIHRIHQ